jgi:citrate synthase
VLAGIAALSGPLHGAATERTRAFLSGIERPGDAAEAVATRLQHGELLPGFGHFLYREGDPRAAELLEQIKLDPIAAAVLQAGRSMGGVEPNVDFALVALERSFELPPGAALALFAIGRSVGWLAHVFEQRASGRLIRPRAEFVME